MAMMGSPISLSILTPKVMSKHHMLDANSNPTDVISPPQTRNARIVVIQHPTGMEVVGVRTGVEPHRLATGTRVPLGDLPSCLRHVTLL